MLRQCNSKIFIGATLGLLLTIYFHGMTDNLQNSYRRWLFTQSERPYQKSDKAGKHTDFNISIDDWRRMEAWGLENIVQEKIHKVMNPANCTDREIFFCHFTFICGFGCTLHTILYCATLSMMHNRPLILLDKGWRYAPKGWDTVFQPISETCVNVTMTNPYDWKGKPLTDKLLQHKNPIAVSSTKHLGRSAMKTPCSLTGRSQGLHARIIHRKFVKFGYDPVRTIPREVLPDIRRVHKQPVAWWVGQLMRYVLRPKTDLFNYTTDVFNRIGFRRPIVGVHVRRTDKLQGEAKAYSIRQYMDVVERYFDRLQATGTRRVYIATDEVSVIVEARKLYPNYEILSNHESGANHYSTDGLRHIVTDIQILSACDYVVYTFSSNVCRAVYELMQANNIDASDNCYSLDETYSFR